jgi:hypothetical protein
MSFKIQPKLTESGAPDEIQRSGASQWRGTTKADGTQADAQEKE